MLRNVVVRAYSQKKSSADKIKKVLKVVEGEVKFTSGKYVYLGLNHQYCFKTRVGRDYFTGNLVVDDENNKVELARNGQLVAYTKNGRDENGDYLKITCHKTYDKVLASFAGRLPSINATVEVDTRPRAEKLADFIEGHLNKGFKL